jgi:hypothetical protein
MCPADISSMRTIPILVLISFVGELVPANAADYYKLPDIKLLHKDLYQAAEVIIETRSCLHGASGEQALLKYEGPGKYQIIWEDQSTCDVEKVAALEGSSNDMRRAGLNLSHSTIRYAALAPKNELRMMFRKL